MQTKQYQTITAYENNSVEINATYFHHSLLILPKKQPMLWPVTSFDQLKKNHFIAIAITCPDVIILGTGQYQHFINPNLITTLISRRIGIECMNNQAACQTYNILLNEERKVVLALIIEKIKTI